MNSRISVEKVKQGFKKTLTRKEVQHMAALEKASITIKDANLK